MGEIHNIGKQIDFNNLTYYFKNKNISPTNFIGFRGPLHIYNNIKNDNTSLEKIDKDKKQFKSKINNITTENPKHKSKHQLNTIEDIRNLYNSSEKVIKVYNGYVKFRSEAMYKAKQETGLEILTPKQMLQRLPIVLSQVKVVNN